jgi:adenylate cyclase
MITRVGEFFDEKWPEPAEPEAEVQPAPPLAVPEFRTVLFTDIENHTTLMQRLGDAEGREMLRVHERATREALQRFSGTEVKTMGDGFLASFRSIQRALDCAVELQRRLSSEEHGLPAGFRIRVGINAGEPIEEDGDLFGSSVITAARIVGLAKGGEILVSNVVRELVAGKGHLFSDRGVHVLRGFDEPMRLWELMWREHAAVAAG